MDGTQPAVRGLGVGIGDEKAKKMKGQLTRETLSDGMMSRMSC